MGERRTPRYARRRGLPAAEDDEVVKSYVRGLADLRMRLDALRKIEAKVPHDPKLLDRTRAAYASADELETPGELRRRPRSAHLPHAELHGPKGERLDQQGITVPEKSISAHMTITDQTRARQHHFAPARAGTR
ncbi:MAG: hypothetical protein WBP81_22090 [Solirubrobacteraceae bacterium]